MSKTTSFIGVCVCVHFLNMKFYYFHIFNIFIFYYFHIFNMKLTLDDLEITMLESGLELMKS